LRFSIQNTVCVSCLSHACYLPRSSHPPCFDQSNNILWSVHVLKLTIQCSPPCHHFLPLSPNRGTSM
jgi:hypothetical protein